MLRAILNRSWRQHPIRHQLYGLLPPITKTIQVRRTRHAGHCWRSKDELISDVLLWTPAYGQAKAGRPARTYIQQLCGDTGYNPEDQTKAMNDKEKWRERVRDIRAGGTSWWCWWWWLYKLLNFLASLFYIRYHRKDESESLRLSLTAHNPNHLFSERSTSKFKYALIPLKILLTRKKNYERNSKGIVANVLDCGLEVSEFKLKARYYDHFQSNILGKVMNPLFPQLWVKD